MRVLTLKKNRDFSRVYRRNFSAATKLLVIKLAPRKDGVRVGFSVSKKCGKAVVRNKIRRRLKSCFLKMDELPLNADIVFIARAPIADAEFLQIEKDMAYLLRKTSSEALAHRKRRQESRSEEAAAKTD